MNSDSFFSLDSKFMHTMSRIADLILLNLYFLICSVPIFTIGAASTALYTVCFRFDTDREDGVTRCFFRAFRDNFKQATLLWLPILFFAVTASINAIFFYSMPVWIHYLFILFLALLAVVLMIGAYAFPLLSQFNNTTRATVKNALVLSIAYLPRSVLIIALNIFPILLVLLDMVLFLQTGFIWFVIYFSAAAYLNSVLLRKVFAPYMTTEQETEEETT